jgi:hypothetical protein
VFLFLTPDGARGKIKKSYYKENTQLEEKGYMEWTGDEKRSRRSGSLASF